MPIAVSRNSFLDQLDELPPLSVATQSVLTVTESPMASADHVARALRSDPAIAAKLLRIVNSPFYGASREITQLSRAVTRLGLTAVRNLVLGLGVQEVLACQGKQKAQYEILWRHALVTGAACELLAHEFGYNPTEEAFIAGLLHDTGSLVLLMTNPTQYDEMLARDAAHSDHLDWERQSFGLDHSEAGYQVMTRWKLPEILCQSVKDHHLPTNALAESSDSLLAIVVLGDMLAHLFGTGLERPLEALERARTAGRVLKIELERLPDLLADFEQHVEHCCGMLAESRMKRLLPKKLDEPRSLYLIKPDDESPNQMSCALLGQQGYAIEIVNRSAGPPEIAADTLVLIDAGEPVDKQACVLAGELKMAGHGQLVLLADAGPDQAWRRRDVSTQVCCIPRNFSLRDFRWFKEETRR